MGEKKQLLFSFVFLVLNSKCVRLQQFTKADKSFLLGLGFIIVCNKTRVMSSANLISLGDSYCGVSTHAN